MSLSIDSALASKYPGLDVEVYAINGIRVRRENSELEKFKAEIAERVKKRWTLEVLKEYNIFRAYRDFFWRVGIDPTKNRPASEALIRRILHGNPLPKINTVVDAYNLASIESTIAIAAFDRDELKGNLLMREAYNGETFLGIGMTTPIRLRGGEIVVSDDEKLIAIYPYRDAESSKITEDTLNLLVLICGVPNIDKKQLLNARGIASEYILRFSRED